MEDALDYNDRVALWQMTNCLLVTSLRDGQSIIPIEFIAVKEAEKKLSRSCVILSEFSGCNRALGGILRVNPFNVEEIAKAIDLSIQMVPEEREQRLQRSFTYIKDNSCQKWAENFIKDLKRHAQNEKAAESGTMFQFLGLGL
jgi:trehalose 6-phosphate synthase/phosphatase